MGRKRIGIIYRGGKGWIGGVYYIQNIINALNTLPDAEKPLIDIYTDTKDMFDDLASLTRYPYLIYNVYKVNKLMFWTRKVCKLISYNIQERLPLVSFNKEDTFVFPDSQGNPKQLLAWIPDFQENHLPEMFDKETVKLRILKNRYIADHINHLVLSSNDCKNDFIHFFPNYKCKIHILHFAVTLPDFSSVKVDELKVKFGIEGDYIFCPNQFWKHKNHLFLFRAYNKALKKGLKLQLVCTGNLSDDRNPKYIHQIREFLDSNHLENHIKILGFIKREEMLCLIKNSYAVVQPSLFEGWSTVVEDAKAVNKFIFLSALKVHREQIDKNVCFFNPHDEDDLCNKLLIVKPTEEPRDYSQNVKNFGLNFLNIINDF